VKRRFQLFTSVVWIAGMLLASPDFSLADEAPTWQYGLSFSYLTGDYGEGDDTDIFYTAGTIKRYLDKGDVTLTIPYIDISDDGVTFIDGGAEAVAGASGGSGLGDIILKGRYYAIEQDGPLPYIDLVGSIKFPTADEDKGLGTGETDFTMMAEFARRLENSATRSWASPPATMRTTAGSTAWDWRTSWTPRSPSAATSTDVPPSSTATTIRCRSC